MQIDSDTTPMEFTAEEQRKYSPILKLRKADNSHFRREFKALGEEQARFLEYMNMKTLQKPDPILHGFRLSEAPAPEVITPDKKKRRCTLL